MQTVIPALQAELDKGQIEPRVLVDLLEFYAHDELPGADGFDPADAIETFAAQEITWNGIAYRREFKVRGEASRSMGEKTNSASLTFSNITRYMATWAQTQQIEGMILVIRTVSPDVEDDSLVLFVGRCDKPGDINKQEFPLTVRQDFGNINVTLPTSEYVAEDPNGHLPSNPLYEGIRFVSLSGFGPSGTVTVPSKSFFGKLFGKSKRVTVTEQWSSLDFTPYGKVIREIFGLVQVEAESIMFQDTGYWLEGLWVWCKGPIVGVFNITVKNFASYGLFGVQTHTGQIGGTGNALPTIHAPEGLTPKTGGNITEDMRFPGSGLFSRLAFTGASILQSGINDEPVVIDTPPIIVGLVQGRVIDLPDSSGVYNREGWSDNGVHQSRFIFTNERFININPAFMEDAVNYRTGLHCDEPILDDTGSQTIVIPSAEIAQAGTSFKRFRATGIFTPTTVLGFSGDESGPTLEPINGGGPYEPLPDPIPASFTPEQILRKRYTTNFTISEDVKGVDLIYKTIFPTFKGFMRVNKHGKYEIHSEKSADATRLRAPIAVGATTALVLDVTPWKTGPDLLTGRLLTGFGLTTSEVRDLLSADFSTSGNAVTLEATDSGTTTATASGATLSGGSTSVQASGTVTVGGTPAAGDTISAVIDGIEVSYTLKATDTTETAAAMLSAFINATPRLKPYIKAFWDVADPSVVTVKCLHGALNLTSTTGFPTFLKAHGGPIADPSVAPTAVGSAGGSLAAGAWNVAYADVKQLQASPEVLETTALTPVTTVIVTADQKIDVSGLPALVGVSRYFYLSREAGSTQLRYVATRTNASDFSISAAPDSLAALPPSYNTTGEELLRVAMSFATNSQDIYSAWPASTLILLNDIYLPTVLNGHKYQVSTGGTTGGAEPVWPTTVGGTVASGTAVFTEIGSTVLAQAGLKRANILKDTFKWPLGSTQSSVNQIKGNFRDPTLDYALRPFKVNDRAHYGKTKKWLPREVDYTAVDNLHQVLRLANADLAKNREGDWFNALGTGPQGLPLEEGDLICCSDDSGGLVNVVTRIEDLGIQSNHHVSIKKARKYSTRMFSDDVGSEVIPIPTTLRYVQTVDSVIAFIDNFAIREADALIPGFYVAVSRDLGLIGDWRGWKLYADYGDGYVAIPGAQGDIAATMGIADTILGTVSDPTAFDTIQTFTADSGTDLLTVTDHVFVNGNSVQVSNSGGALPAPLVAGTTYFVRDVLGDTFKLAATSGGTAINLTTNGTGTNSVRNVLSFTLKFGTPDPAPQPFETVTQADLIANPYKNFFSYGNEYLQAATVVNNGSQSYTVSNFYRGRFGTDTTQLTHGADEDVVFLNGAEKFVAIDPLRVGIAYNYKVVTTNQDVADATPVSFTWGGGTGKGRAVRNVILATDMSDDTLIWFEGFDPAADYRVEVYSDTGRTPATLLGTLPVTTGTSHAALLVSNRTGGPTFTGGDDVES